MKHEDRKAAIAAYKERKPAAGIYAIRCAANGACWVGSAPNLDTIRNRIWFTLREASHPNAAVRAAWRAHGAQAFSYEELERLDDDLGALTRERMLKDRLAHWVGALRADPV